MKIFKTKLEELSQEFKVPLEIYNDNIFREWLFNSIFQAKQDHSSNADTPQPQPQSQPSPPVSEIVQELPIDQVMGSPSSLACGLCADV